jgi:hypothetical protein
VLFDLFGIVSKNIFLSCFGKEYKRVWERRGKTDLGAGYEEEAHGDEHSDARRLAECSSPPPNQ